MFSGSGSLKHQILVGIGPRRDINDLELHFFQKPSEIRECPLNGKLRKKAGEIFWMAIAEGYHFHFGEIPPAMEMPF